MVSRFRKTLSFNKPNPSPSTHHHHHQSKNEKSYHVRSISLPCRSHPLISQLKDEINELKTWESSKPNDRTSAWLCDGLIRLKNVHDSVDDLLQLPQTQESLRRQSSWVDKLLDDFLRFVDVYGIFRAALVNLKEEQSAAQIAIRRRDESKIGSSYVKARKKMDKEMVKLVSSIRNHNNNNNNNNHQVVVVNQSQNHHHHDQMLVVVSDGDAELGGILRDVNEVTVTVSVCVFNGISRSSMGFSYCKPHWMGMKGFNKLWSKKKSMISWMEEGGRGIREFEEVDEVERLMMRLRRRRKQGEEEVIRRVLMKLEALENSIGGIENESERVFRSLINTRVSLLNILTQ